ncbi:response regulator transcription factor [Flavobacterium algicola]|uniref:response regulator transcription factor n=1 Tax=Flavobacterium algicola TaxID=556529 RepID=UPI001EFE6A63|nr:response regulator transcription factor [Flavobacterium algicola]MCG9793249.1 response regulator transcription factor [Flavobacterium algicola]
MKVLIIEDQKSLVQDIVEYLSNSQIITEKAFTFEEAKGKIISFEYDVILIDLMLPGGNGLDLVELLKEIHSKSAILIITAKDSLEDKIQGLERGADDYLSKPFHLAELKARIIALYRRTRLSGNSVIIFEEIEIDTNTKNVKVCGNVLVLTQKEYELLLLFLSNKNRVLGKNTIAESLWGDYVDAYDNYDFIYQHIKNLRKKMIENGSKPFIQNVYGTGYKFNTYLNEVS